MRSALFIPSIFSDRVKIAVDRHAETVSYRLNNGKIWVDGKDKLMDKKMANDGWVELDGNGMPVDGNTMVLVKFRDASPYYWIEGLERPASSCMTKLQLSAIGCISSRRR